MVRRPRRAGGGFYVEWPEKGQTLRSRAVLKTSRAGRSFFNFTPGEGVRQACVVSGGKVLCKDGAKWVEAGRTEQRLGDTVAVLDKWRPMTPGAAKRETIG